MALTLESMRFVHTGLGVAQRDRGQSQSVLSLGYPDILPTTDDVGKLFGLELAAALEFRAHSESIARWHGLPSGSRIPESAHFFAIWATTWRSSTSLPRVAARFSMI